MKAYLMISGTLFGVLLIAHLLRLYGEGLQVAADPWFVLSTVLSGWLCVWAVRLLRQAARS